MKFLEIFSLDIDQFSKVVFLFSCQVKLITQQLRLWLFAKNLVSNRLQDLFLNCIQL